MKIIFLVLCLISVILNAADIGEIVNQAAKDTGKEINRIVDKFAETLKSKDSKKDDSSDSKKEEQMDKKESPK